jgi:hypothetical protein
MTLQVCRERKLLIRTGENQFGLAGFTVLFRALFLEHAHSDGTVHLGGDIYRMQENRVMMRLLNGYWGSVPETRIIEFLMAQRNWEVQRSHLPEQLKRVWNRAVYGSGTCSSRISLKGFSRSNLEDVLTVLISTREHTEGGCSVGNTLFKVAEIPIHRTVHMVSEC